MWTIGLHRKISKIDIDGHTWHVPDKEIDGRAAFEREARLFGDNRDNADEESHLLAVAFTERHQGLRER